MNTRRQHKGSVMWSLALHLAVLAAVVIGLPWRIERPRVAVNAAPIQGVIIDQAAIERERAAREEAARQVRVQQQREERQRREAAEQERQRVAAAERAKQQAEQEERDRVAAEKAEQQRREREAQAERERVARERAEQEKREKEAAEKRARELAEQRRRQQAESELQQQLALEAEANAARDAGLLDQYIRMLESRIKQHWNRPLSARPGLDCKVQVVQLPTGDVVSAVVTSCNGDDAVRRSIERAVMDASPLPRPPNAALFQRNINVTFRPEE
jgi:colicin import membrane protein